MRIIADLHLHSKFSRATSPQMNLDSLTHWAKLKGINLLGTGDFTHPFWFNELKSKLIPAKNGLYQLAGEEKISFLPTAEISSIYSQGGALRKIHTVVIVPTLEAAEKINKKLAGFMKLDVDGRPITGVSAKDLARLILEIESKALIIPAHAWTPWFSVFGSSSGFDSLEECYGDLTKNIFAIETGLSSDPAMNWQLSALDNITLISNSDAHSPANLMREANVFDLQNNSYDEFYDAIKNKDKNKFLYTVEFYPEEGKYHFDGHRNCKFVNDPREKEIGICPDCQRPLTIGVMSRVQKLADHPAGRKPENHIPFKSLVQLNQIIAEAMGKSEIAKAVQDEYLRMVSVIGSEFEILVDRSLDELAKAGTLPKVVDGISRVRAGKISIAPGYDGEFGKVKVFGGEEDIVTKTAPAQPSLF